MCQHDVETDDFRAERQRDPLGRPEVGRARVVGRSTECAAAIESRRSGFHVVVSRWETVEPVDAPVVRPIPGARADESPPAQRELIALRRHRRAACRLPVLVARGMRAQGARVACVAFRGHADPELQGLCEHFEEVSLYRRCRLEITPSKVVSQVYTRPLWVV